MISLKLENTQNNICVICNELIERGSYWQCKKCRCMCQPAVTNFMDDNNHLTEIKSGCCDADVENHKKLTCSDTCHQKMIHHILQKFGPYKKITDSHTGLTYRVPTKQILEKGIAQEDLRNFPLWD